MPIVTLTSDFGTKDHSVAMVKARLLSLIPNVVMVDISHDVSPYNIRETSFIVKSVFQTFPEKTIHLIGTDAEFEPEKPHVMVQYKNHYFIGADNGFFSLLNPNLQFQQVFEIQHPLSKTSIFPLNDVFCEIAAAVVQNKYSKWVTPKNQINIWKISEPDYSNEHEIIAHIQYIDRFGNLITDLEQKDFNQRFRDKKFEIFVSSARLKQIYQKYDDFKSEFQPQQRPAGKALAVFNSSGLLEIALYKSSPEHGGSAAELLGLKVGDSIKIVKND